MRKNNGLLSMISFVLVCVMLISLGSVLRGMGFVEPSNPIGQGPNQLFPDALEGNGELSGGGEGIQVPPPSTAPPSQPNEGTRPTQPEETRPGDDLEPTVPSDRPGDVEQGPDQNVGDADPGNSNGGNSDTNNENNGPAGDNGNGEGAGGDAPGNGDNDAVKIVTDLRNQQIARTELPEGILHFYAYPSVNDAGYTIKVVVKNSATPVNGLVLESADNVHYAAPLVLNETTSITLYLKLDGENVAYVRYQIRYEMEKADEDNLEVGDNPPSIITNLDGYTDIMEAQDFLLWVSARTNPEGDPIYSNQIEVWLNGQLVPKQTGDSRPEYELHFEPPNVGDYAKYTVKIRAWDGKGNSTMKIYTINYHTVSEGDYLGTVQIVLDATTVGLGIIDSATYEIVQGDTAAGVVIRFLEEYGYEPVYSGSAKVGFYLRSISRGDLCYGAKVPDSLWNMILRDRIQLSGHSDRDSLGEYDYTMGSGWMYSINGSVYPGRGLSEYKLSKNTTIYLRFTLAYGKDIGGFDATGQGIGSLSSYCGVWINGGFTPLDHNYVETERREPTDTEDGYVHYRCSKCGEEKNEIIPASGKTILPERMLVIERKEQYNIRKRRGSACFRK